MKNVDVIWNGMTQTPEVKASMACTKPYCNNAQVVVVKSVSAEQYREISNLHELTFYVEAGSAGEAAAMDKNLNVVSVDLQTDALEEVQAHYQTACVIDLLMAGAMLGEGNSYPDLSYTLELTKEKYVIGCRKGSDLKDFINDAMERYRKDGSLQALAEEYGVQEAVIR